MKQKDHRIHVPPLDRPAQVRRDILQAVRSNGEVTFGRLKDDTGLAKSTLAKHLKELRRKGELVKEESPEDARVVYYSLSLTGQYSCIKEDIVSGLQTMPARTVKEFRISSIPPFPILEVLLAEDKEDKTLPLTRGLLKKAIYEGLQRSASATVLSEHEFVAGRIGFSGVAETYVSLLGSHLTDEKMKSYEEFEKQQLQGFAERVKSELQQSPKQDEELLERLTDEAVKMERQRVEWIRQLFNFRFSIVLEYDGKGLAKVLDEHIGKLGVLRKEYRQYIAEFLNKDVAASPPQLKMPTSTVEYGVEEPQEKGKN